MKLLIILLLIFGGVCAEIVQMQGEIPHNLASLALTPWQGCKFLKIRLCT